METPIQIFAKICVHRDKGPECIKNQKSIYQYQSPWIFNEFTSDLKNYSFTNESNLAYIYTNLNSRIESCIENYFYPRTKIIYESSCIKNLCLQMTLLRISDVFTFYLTKQLRAEYHTYSAPPIEYSIFYAFCRNFIINS